MILGEVTVIHEGQECEVEWKLKFASISIPTYVDYRSPYFSFENESRWCLQCNDSILRESGRYFSLRLSKFSKGPPINVEFTFALKTIDGRKDFVKRNTGDFECLNVHGFRKFLSYSPIARRRSEFVSRGYITVVCTLKRLNSRGSTSNIALTSCSKCKTTVEAEKLSSLEKKYGVNCPECSNFILLENCDEYKISRAEAATNQQESFVDPLHDKFLKDFKQLFLKQELYDVVLRVEGREFQAHKAILGARSPVFLSTFRNDMKEKKTGIVDIEDCDPSIFSDFLCFLYSNDLDNLSAQNVFGLFTVADRYDIPDLRGKCLEFMKKNLSIVTFCETLTLASQHSEVKLIHAATDFFIKNAKDILVTVKWQSFAAANSTQSNELFIKFVESVKGPNT